MQFRFENKVTAADIWRMSMYHIYHSMAGVCNIIFSVAMVLLTVKFWNPQEAVLMMILVICCVLFPIVQPIMIYMRAAKQVAALPGGMVFEINDAGLLVTANEQKSHITWEHIRGVIKERNMIILAAEGGRGYMLTDKMLGAQKEALLEFLETKIKRKS